jgi:hypothetical protein
MKVAGHVAGHVAHFGNKRYNISVIKIRDAID